MQFAATICDPATNSADVFRQYRRVHFIPSNGGVLTHLPKARRALPLSRRRQSPLSPPSDTEIKRLKRIDSD